MLTLIGPHPDDGARFLDLIDSLCTYEPHVAAIIVADDSDSGSRLKTQIRVPDGCEVVFLRNPNSSRDFLSLGRNVLMGLEYIKSSLPVQFIVKLDSDALVISPFSARIATRLGGQPDAGMLGLLSNSCNRSRSSFHAQDELKGFMEELLKMGSCDDAAAEQLLRRWPSGARRTVAGLRQFCKRFEQLAGARFIGKHCNGGAYAVSATMINRMASLELFADREMWSQFPYSEDRMMGLYCALCGLQPCDFSDREQVFGTQSSGLAYAPQDLVDRGYGIIHSVKNDPQLTEPEIREWFRWQRRRLRNSRGESEF
ncbi:hypothetical protein [Bradyrhizobium sp. BWC-3-1]|uniref:hypothetical protein n=1 Tax=Bradyrhizobium sp. BWC-3-1 TaxID=3080012 RepID=UPI00293EC78A|nr:hypothetical protein [Bradyrhizobium sp. BWC-3-1]WOH57006.1 hypothetical protein RX329_32910 [Bradyrhizobium sp. BWC-3-1]